MVGRTPVQEGGSSGCGGAAPSDPAEVDRQSGTNRVVPMPLDPESRKRASEDRDEGSKRKGGVVLALKAAGQTKRRPEFQGVPEKGTRLAPTSASGPEAEQMDDAQIPLDLERKMAEKRSASDVEELIRVTHPVDLVEVEDAWMSRLEVEEKKTIHIATDDYYMPMTVCEETLDISWMESKKARMLGEVIGCTDVGPVRDQVSRRLIQYVNEELVEPWGWKSLAG